MKNIYGLRTLSNNKSNVRGRSSSGLFMILCCICGNKYLLLDLIDSLIYLNNSQFVTVINDFSSDYSQLFYHFVAQFFSSTIVFGFFFLSLFGHLFLTFAVFI